MRMSSAHAKKSPTNLSVRADLVRRAKALDINLSELFERALEEAILRREREKWLAHNQDAIRAYNTAVSKRKLFSEGWRRF